MSVKEGVSRYARAPNPGISADHRPLSRLPPFAPAGQSRSTSPSATVLSRPFSVARSRHASARAMSSSTGLRTLKADNAGREGLSRGLLAEPPAELDRVLRGAVQQQESDLLVSPTANEVLNTEHVTLAQRRFAKPAICTALAGPCRLTGAVLDVEQHRANWVCLAPRKASKRSASSSNAPRRNKPATSVTGRPSSSTSRTTRYGCSTTFNSTSTNLLPPLALSPCGRADWRGGWLSSIRRARRRPSGISWTRGVKYLPGLLHGRARLAYDCGA